MSKVHHLTSPFSEEVIRSLHAGDIVYFDGPLFGIRDLTQIHIFDHNNPPPVSLEGMPCIHTAPSLRKVGDKWEKICVGTTTSTRMDRFTPGLIGQYGVRAIIGKGGLYQGSLEAMKQYGAVYLAIVGGALWVTPRLAKWLDQREAKNKSYFDGMLEEDPAETADTSVQKGGDSHV